METRSEQIQRHGADDLLKTHRRTNDLVDLVTKSRTVLSSFAKAKTAKLGMLYPRCTHTLLTDNNHSSSTARPLSKDSKHNRHTNRCYEVMYRMGDIRKAWLLTPEPRNSSRCLIYGEAVIL